MFSKHQASTLASKVLLLQVGILREIYKELVPGPQTSSELGWLHGNVSSYPR